MPGQFNAGQPQELRTFVLAPTNATAVTLDWRPLGDGPFQPLPATWRSRQAWRAVLPAQPRGAVELYLEATTPALNRTAIGW